MWWNHEVIDGAYEVLADDPLLVELLAMMQGLSIIRCKTTRGIV